jgi:hypothetical protein
MAYTHTHPHDLGLDLGPVLTSVLSAVSSGPTLEAVSKVVLDPALPEVACNVLRLNHVIEGRPAGIPCSRKVYTADQKRKGVGLYMAVTPLRIVTWARENPAVAIGVGAGVISLIFGLGYIWGKGSKRV